MPVNLSIKNVPGPLAERLRQRATRHHRSLQGELIAILEESVGGDHALTPAEVLAKVRDSDLRTEDESVNFIREDRNDPLRR